jgi:release factor glutamine methyltransferase
MSTSITDNTDKTIKKIGELLVEGERKLREINNKGAAEEPLILLSYLLNKEKFDLLLNRFSDVSPQKTECYFNWLEKRLKGIPVQYITGFQNFMGMEFKMKQGVFIPRPETEILVEEIIKIIEAMPNKTKLFFLDIGVGSGVIPISICYHFQNTNKNIHFFASDISSDAIKLAKENADKFSCSDRITFLCGDFFKIQKLNLPLSFDGIISNPPYISRTELLNLPNEVYYYEPTKALYGGTQGLDYYQKITSKSSEYLKKDNGFLALEIGHKQRKSVSKIIKSAGFFQEKILTFQDYYQNDRVIIAFT